MSLYVTFPGLWNASNAPCTVAIPFAGNSLCRVSSCASIAIERESTSLTSHRVSSTLKVFCGRSVCVLLERLV